MKIAFNHLQRFFIKNPSILDVSDKLFQLGHEHELNSGIFDFEFTPNRGDCLSLLGLLRDLKAFYEINLNLNIYKAPINKFNLDFTNEAKFACPSITFLKINALNQNTEYKDYLEDYFIDFGIKKNNFFTDISNFIAYELGQPLHCYDYDKINGNITLKQNKKDIEFNTLLDKTINLNGDELIFNDSSKPINLAGIIGGKDTACSKDTKNLLVECAYFKPEYILGKALRYDVHSEASHKFERGVDPLCHDFVIRRFIQIVKDHLQIESIEIFTKVEEKYEAKSLEFDLKKIKQIMGCDINEDSYKKVLLKLGFEVNKNIIIPSYRQDISHQNDLAEEWARVKGYDSIPADNIDLPMVVNQNIPDKKIQNIKQFLVVNGFTEVINIPFSDKNTHKSIKVINPLFAKKKYLRHNILDSLVNNLIYNEKRQKDSLKLFEVSDIYSLNGGDFLKEKKLAIVISGRRGHNHIEFSKQLDKNYLSNLFKNIGLDVNNFIKLINRDTLDTKITNQIFGLEINIEDLDFKIDDSVFNYSPLQEYTKYQPISEFPSSTRDISFSIEDFSKIDVVIEKIQSIRQDNLKEFFMFDYFENKKRNTVKIGYRFIFQSNKKTLTDKDINHMLKEILEPLLSIKSITVPGLNNF